VRHAEQSVTGVFRGRGQVTEADLRSQMFEFRSTFAVMVGEAADRISNETTDTQVRRRSLLWKIRMPDAATIVVANPNPREAYVEALTLAIAQRQFLVDGGGSGLFGPQQPIAVDAARKIEERAVAIGQSFLTAEQLGELRLDLEKLASENPIRGEFLREGVAAGIEKAESGGAFNEILALPMAPFRALEGVDTGAQAIREFNVTAQQATDIVADLPQRVRWQMELLTYDLQAQGAALQQALASFDTLAPSSDRLSLAAESLPEDARATLEAASAELEQVQKLLAEYRAAVAETTGALTRSQPLVDALARTAEQVNQAGAAWNSIVTQLETPNEPPPPGTPPRRRSTSGSTSRPRSRSRERPRSCASCSAT
jgi:hypothetical protein